MGSKQTITFHLFNRIMINSGIGLGLQNLKQHSLFHVRNCTSASNEPHNSKSKIDLFRICDAKTI